MRERLCACENGRYRFHGKKRINFAQTDMWMDLPFHLHNNDKYYVIETGKRNHRGQMQQTRYNQPASNNTQVVISVQLIIAHPLFENENDTMRQWTLKWMVYRNWQDIASKWSYEKFQFHMCAGFLLSYSPIDFFSSFLRSNGVISKAQAFTHFK